MAIDDTLDPWAACKLILGIEWKMEIPKEVPEFSIPPGRVDEIYLIVMKLKRFYYPGQGYWKAEKFVGPIASVENAYMSQDMKAFTEAVKHVIETTFKYGGL